MKPPKESSSMRTHTDFSSSYLRAMPPLYLSLFSRSISFSRIDRFLSLRLSR